MLDYIDKVPAIGSPAVPTRKFECVGGEVPLAQDWDELVSPAPPAPVTVGSCQLLPRVGVLEELEPAGWILLVEGDYFPMAWKTP